MTTVLLWDIDGTLLTTARAGIFALEKAASEVIGTPVSLTDLKTAGQVDWELGGRILQQYDLAPEPEKIAEMLTLYSQYLPASLSRRRGSVLGGVQEILTVLQGRTDVLSLLLTGNIEAGAQAKLAHYGLDAYLSKGAFADWAENRSAIAHQALKLAQQMVGEPIISEKLYVIGDTPYDIHCSQVIGARAIAVATGSYTLEELQQQQPWLALPELPEPDIFLSLLGL